MAFCVHQFRRVPGTTLTLEGLGLSAGSLAVPILAPCGVLGSHISKTASATAEGTWRCQQTRAGSNIERIQPGKMWPLHQGINNQKHKYSGGEEGCLEHGATSRHLDRSLQCDPVVGICELDAKK